MSQIGLEFGELVARKYDQALMTDGCLIRQPQRGKVIEQVCLIDPDLNRVHSIQRQPRSHIVESRGDAEFVTTLTDQIGVIYDPQRLLVDDKGSVSLLGSRELLEIQEQGIVEIFESLQRSEPNPVDSIEMIAANNSFVDYNQVLDDWLALKDRSLQDRALALLKTGFSSRRYIALEWIEEEDKDFPSMPNSLLFAKANFKSEEFEVDGTIWTKVDKEKRNFSEDSVGLLLNFSLPRFISTSDGDVLHDEYEVKVIEDEVFVETTSQSGIACLTRESLVLVNDIVDSAVLVPVRAN